MIIQRPNVKKNGSSLRRGFGLATRLGAAMSIVRVVFPTGSVDRGY